MVVTCVVIKASDIARCPKRSLAPAHYRADGTCKCDDREAAAIAFAEAKEAAAVAQRDLAAARKRWEST